MGTAAEVLAVVYGVVLVGIGSLEVFQYRNPRLYSIFVIEPGEYDAVRMWAKCVGCYNLTMAVALFVGVIGQHQDFAAEGKALVLYVAAAHVFLGIVLGVVQPKLWRSAIGEGGFAAVLLVLALS